MKTRQTAYYFLFCLILLMNQVARGETHMEIMKNGLTLIHKQTKVNRIVGVVCMIRTGSAYENPKQNGITNLVQSLLLKGTENYSAQELALKLESLGIMMNTDASEDYASLTAVATLDQLETVLELISEILFRPSFPEREIQKERANIIAHINLQEDNKFQLSLKNLREILFQGHPYSMPPEGTPETLEKIDRNEIIQFHKQYYHPPNMILSVVGDVSSDDLKQSVDRYFQRQSPPDFQIFTIDKTIKPETKIRQIQKPLEQGFLTMGFIGIPMSDPDYPALRVACAVLGEGMACRLFSDLRDRQSLAYMVGSFYLNLKLQGSVVGYIGTRPETLDQAKKGMMDIFENLDEKPIPPEELERAKNFIIGKFLVAHQTNLKKAFYPAWFHLYGLGIDFDDKYPELIKSVTEKQVRRAARKYLRYPSIVTLVPENSTNNNK